VQGLAVAIRRQPGSLSVSYTITGELQRLRIPAPRPARIAERLWQHTCCEIFVARAGEAAYHEFNFSPSGEWAAYAFTGYRSGAVLCDETFAPGISVKRSQTRLVLECRVRVAANKSLMLGLSAVIEDLDGTLSYWALRHPPGKPDFHHRDALALELDEARH
jgi:hypothetical protein